MLEELVGKRVQVTVDEGAQPLHPGLNLRGQVMRLAPEGGPYHHLGVIVELASAGEQGISSGTLLLTPRHKRPSLAAILEGDSVIVHLNLYSPDYRLLAIGTGDLSLQA